MCGTKLPETCSTQDFNGLILTVCNCDTDNCNKDTNCDCSTSTQAPTTQASTTTTSSSSNGLQCQQCDGDGGECSNPQDNGQSVTCNEDQDACWYQSYSKLSNDFSHTSNANQENLGLEDDETVYRSCIDSGGLGDNCVHAEVGGVSATECFCTTDNCNKDHLCDCPSTGLQCQVCDGGGGECSSPSDNGKSVTCNEDQDACFFQSLSMYWTKSLYCKCLFNENLGNGDEEIVYRNCLNSAGIGDECVNSNHNEVRHLKLFWHSFSNRF